MQIAKLLKVRSPLMAALLFLATATSACAQEKPKRMIPGASVKELVPESPTEKEDTIARITIGLLFKPGTTEYTRIGVKGSSATPPLPTGYILFKDLVYNVKTEAVVSGSYTIVFRVPSAENESDFKRLTVLHLEDDEMSPSGATWNPVTVVPGGWDEYFNSVSKNQYEALAPDFKSKQITGITNQFGLFAIALAPEGESESEEPFTQMEITATSSPDAVPEDKNVTYSIVVKNKGPKDAGDVNVIDEVHSYLSFVSASSTQGGCKESTQSNGRVVCHLGAVQIGGSVTITIVARVRPNMMLVKDRTEVGNLLDAAFKERPTDLLDSRGQIHKQLDIVILKKHASP